MRDTHDDSQSGQAELEVAGDAWSGASTRKGFLKGAAAAGAGAAGMGALGPAAALAHGRRKESEHRKKGGVTKGDLEIRSDRRGTGGDHLHQHHQHGAVLDRKS